MDEINTLKKIKQTFQKVNNAFMERREIGNPSIGTRQRLILKTLNQNYTESEWNNKQIVLNNKYFNIVTSGNYLNYQDNNIYDLSLSTEQENMHLLPNGSSGAYGYIVMQN